mmetsp:Transcript_173850/g.422839  ORF Transcript_173850/g.422839 Transcript_173850/m.422839 type:complete len:291 (-) Transcript_173850:414-1286(-)
MWQDRLDQQPPRLPNPRHVVVQQHGDHLLHRRPATDGVDKITCRPRLPLVDADAALAPKQPLVHHLAAPGDETGVPVGAVEHVCGDLRVDPRVSRLCQLHEQRRHLLLAEEVDGYGVAHIERRAAALRVQTQDAERPDGHDAVQAVLAAALLEAAKDVQHLVVDGRRRVLQQVELVDEQHNALALEQRVAVGGVEQRGEVVAIPNLGQLLPRATEPGAHAAPERLGRVHLDALLQRQVHHVEVVGQLLAGTEHARRLARRPRAVQHHVLALAHGRQQHRLVHFRRVHEEE